MRWSSGAARSRARKGRRCLTAPPDARQELGYRELHERIADGLTLRQFADFFCDPVPKHDAFNRGFNRLTPQTSKPRLGLGDGAKLRVDNMVATDEVHVAPSLRFHRRAFRRAPHFYAPIAASSASRMWRLRARRRRDYAFRSVAAPNRRNATLVSRKSIISRKNCVLTQL